MTIFVRRSRVVHPAIREMILGLDSFYKHETGRDEVACRLLGKIYDMPEDDAVALVRHVLYHEPIDAKAFHKYQW